MNELRPYQSELIDALRESYRRGARRPVMVLGCGGGKSVIAAELARNATRVKSGRVLFLVHRRELCDQITRTFIAQGVDMRRCGVMMVQTACRRLDRLAPPTLIIIDEAHHTLAGSYTAVLDRFPNVCAVGVTATPARLGGEGLGRIFDELITGPTTKWLIENNYLAPFEYFSPDVADLTGLHTRNGDYVTSEIDARLIKRAVFGDVIRYYRELAAERQAICYCASVKASMATAAAFCDADIIAEHIDGTTPASIRESAIARFRGGDTQILCNVDLVGEGFDVPDCAVSILLRPTQSLTLYLQQAMRCMRYQPGKTARIIDHVGNYARFGLPDAERAWTLADKPRRKKGERDPDAALGARQCPKCFFTHEWADVCPKCGFVYPARVQEPEEIREAQLKRIEGFVLNYAGPEECRTYKELQAYARKMNYKPGWAWYQARARGLTGARQ